MRTNPLHEETDFPRGIGRPATGALIAAGYSRLEQLTQVTEADLKKLHGMGPKALSILRQALEMKGLSFAVQKTKGDPLTTGSSPLQNTDFPKLAQPAQRALAGAGYSRLEQLTQITETDLKKLHGMGPNALKQLRSALEAKGWSFAAEQA